MATVYGTGAAILGSGATQPARHDDADLAEARRTNRPVSLGQAARLYRRSTHTLKAAIQAGELRAHCVGARQTHRKNGGPGRYEVYPADVDAWIQSERIETDRERAQRLLKARRA